MTVKFLTPGDFPRVESGKKNDGRTNSDGSQKLRFDLIPAESLEQLANVYTYGAKKYEDHNWRKGLCFSRIFAAIMRHLWAFWRGEDKDTESGLSHLSHAAWGCFSLMEFVDYRKELDDRYQQDFCQCKDERACTEKDLNSWTCTVCNRRIK